MFVRACRQASYGKCISGLYYPTESLRCSCRDSRLGCPAPSEARPEPYPQPPATAPEQSRKHSAHVTPELLVIPTAAFFIAAEGSQSPPPWSASLSTRPRSGA